LNDGKTQAEIAKFLGCSTAKEYIANRLFPSIEDLECLLHQLLNEGELVIKWSLKLKNKGNAIITV
jgi:hypothetical protein